MQAGQLNEIITIYIPIHTKNEYGEVVEEWKKHTSTKANITYSGGNRNIQNGELFFGYTKIFKVYRYVDINESMIIEWQNKRYKIISIEDVKQYNEKIITAEIINE